MDFNAVWTLSTRHIIIILFKYIQLLIGLQYFSSSLNDSLSRIPPQWPSPTAATPAVPPGPCQLPAGYIKNCNPGCNSAYEQRGWGLIHANSNRIRTVTSELDITPFRVSWPSVLLWTIIFFIRVIVFSFFITLFVDFILSIHGGSVRSTVASQQEGCGFKSRIVQHVGACSRAFLCGVCMFSPCSPGFPP